MAQNEELYKAIEIIERRIQTLSQLRQGFIDEFNLNSDKKTKTTLELPSKGFNAVVTKRVRARRKKPTNRDVIIKFLRENGPHGRRDIADKTGIPMGSVPGVLTDKKTFYTKNEIWHLVEKQSEDKES